ncbi:hypothetical protein L1887_19509 [Cichorium endivia]|nr:hypothetical protein L1887_19509 [Cichorium endivia]
MSSSSNKIVLKSSDGEIFEMEESEARLSELIKDTIELECVQTFIPISTVTGEILSMVVEYCQQHANTTNDDDALKLFDSQFVDNKNIVTLTELGKAARFLRIWSLEKLSCDTLFKMF